MKELFLFLILCVLAISFAEQERLKMIEIEVLAKTHQVNLEEVIKKHPPLFE